MAFTKNDRFNAYDLVIDESVEMARQHQFISGDHRSNRRRELPEVRFGFMMNALIDLTTGRTELEGHVPSIFTIGHGAMSELTGMAVATSFVYMNTKSSITTCVLEWAKANLESTNDESADAAIQIIMQYAASYPDLAREQGYEISLT